jgi:prepilin-type N-terminal cleavage/methylation domain-containing protein
MPTIRKGFTLIELLIVVVIIGILAAIAIPKFANTKNKAYVASMKSDLRNLVSAQESYFSDNNSTYAASTAALGSIIHGSSGVTVTIGNSTMSTWDATASHNVSTVVCSITYGSGMTGNGAPLCQ